MKRQFADDSISEAVIREKVMMPYCDFLKDTLGNSAERGPFKGAWGWFEKFKKRKCLFTD